MPRGHIEVKSRERGTRMTHDHGHGPVRPRAPGPRPGGFGLHLVNELAARWGVSQDHGTRVWFELAAGSSAA